MPAPRISLTYAQFTERVGRGGLVPILAFKQPSGTEVVVLIVKVNDDPVQYETWEVSV